MNLAYGYTSGMESMFNELNKPGIIIRFSDIKCCTEEEIKKLLVDTYYDCECVHYAYLFEPFYYRQSAVKGLNITSILNVTSPCLLFINSNLIQEYIIHKNLFGLKT